MGKAAFLPLPRVKRPRNPWVSNIDLREDSNDGVFNAFEIAWLGGPDERRSVKIGRKLIAKVERERLGVRIVHDG